MRMPETKQPSRFVLLLSNIILRLKAYLYFLSPEKARFNNFVSKIGYLGKGAYIEEEPIFCNAPHKIFIEDGCRLSRYSQFLISSSSKEGNFVMKKNSGIAQGLLVITNNHSTKPEVGKWILKQQYEAGGDVNKDVIIGEDVWIGAYVTILCGVKIGRGAIVGTNSVLRTNIPPYAIVNGNPAKIVGYRFTPEQALEHEEKLYPEGERTPMKVLQKNYNKYFDNREKIADYTSLL